MAVSKVRSLSRSGPASSPTTSASAASRSIAYAPEHGDAWRRSRGALDWLAAQRGSRMKTRRRGNARPKE